MLAWGQKVPEEFRNRVGEVAQSLGTDANHLMACMAFESGETFSPSIRNVAGSGAVGLIQFMPSTCQALGTTTEALAAMTAVEQLRYVEKYFKPRKGKLVSLEDVYMAILWPAAIGKPDDYVLSISTIRNIPSAIFKTRGSTSNHDGVITKKEAAAMVRKHLDKGLATPICIGVINVNTHAFKLSNHPQAFSTHT